MEGFYSRSCYEKQGDSAHSISVQTDEIRYMSSEICTCLVSQTDRLFGQLISVKQLGRICVDFAEKREAGVGKNMRLLPCKESL